MYMVSINFYVYSFQFAKIKFIKLTHVAERLIKIMNPS